MTEETIKDILDSRDFRSFGVKGTMERINYYYHSECKIAIHSEIGKYTKVELMLPPNRIERKQFLNHDVTQEASEHEIPGNDH